jgi:hypothetical protein
MKSSILIGYLGIRILAPLHLEIDDCGEESPDSRMQGIPRKRDIERSGATKSKDIGDES